MGDEQPSPLQPPPESEHESEHKIELEPELGPEEQLQSVNTLQFCDVSLFHKIMSLPRVKSNIGTGEVNTTTYEDQRWKELNFSSRQLFLEIFLSDSVPFTPRDDMIWFIRKHNSNGDQSYLKNSTEMNLNSSHNASLSESPPESDQNMVAFVKRLEGVKKIYRLSLAMGTKKIIEEETSDVAIDWTATIQLNLILQTLSFKLTVASFITEQTLVSSSSSSTLLSQPSDSDSSTILVNLSSSSSSSSPSPYLPSKEEGAPVPTSLSSSSTPSSPKSSPQSSPRSKKPSITIIKKVEKEIYADPVYRDVLEKDKPPQLSFPFLHFSVDDYEQSGHDMEIKDGEKLAVQINCRLEGSQLRPLSVFRGSVAYSAIDTVLKTKTSSSSTAIMAELIFGRPVKTIILKGPRGHGSALLYVEKKSGSRSMKSFGRTIVNKWFTRSSPSILTTPSSSDKKKSFNAFFAFVSLNFEAIIDIILSEWFHETS